MGALSFRPALTYYTDGSSKVSLEPKLTFDWFPSVPFTASIRIGWTRRLLDNSNVLRELVFGTIEMIWYPSLHTILQLNATIKKVYCDILATEKGLTLTSELELRVGLPIPKGSLDFILGGGYEWRIDSGDPQAEDGWFARVGLEMKL